MKNMLIFLVFLGITICFAQSPKKINWGEDPVNLAYNGTDGMVTIKALYSPFVSTQGKSGKWTRGMSGNGMLFDIDSVIFFSRETITEGIAFVCGNPVEFLDSLDRSKIQIVKKEIIVPLVPLSCISCIQTPEPQGPPRRNDRGRRIVKVTSNSSTKYYILGGLVIAGIVYALLEKDDNHQSKVFSSSGDGGKNTDGTLPPTSDGGTLPPAKISTQRIKLTIGF